MVSFSTRLLRIVIVAGISVLVLSACGRLDMAVNEENGSRSSVSSSRARSSLARSTASVAQSQSSAPGGSAESSATFFSLKRSSSSMRKSQQASSAESVRPSMQKLDIRIDLDREEARPGDDIFATVILHNASAAPLTNFQVVYSFSPVQLAILESDGVTGVDHVRWTVDNLAPRQNRALRVRAQLQPGLQHGAVVRSTAIITVNGVVDPATAIADVRVIQQLPATGLADGTRPLENTRRFLSPFRGNGSTGAIPAVIWIATVLLGLGFGATLVKKYAEEDRDVR